MISTLNLYLVRRFAVWLMIVTLGFGAIAMLGDFLEMLRLANRLNLGAARPLASPCTACRFC